MVRLVIGDKAIIWLRSVSNCRVSDVSSFAVLRKSGGFSQFSPILISDRDFCLWLVSLVEVTRCYSTLHSPKNTDEHHALIEFDFHLDWSIAIVFKAREEIGFQYSATDRRSPSRKRQSELCKTREVLRQFDKPRLQRYVSEIKEKSKKPTKADIKYFPLTFLSMHTYLFHISYQRCI